MTTCLDPTRPAPPPPAASGPPRASRVAALDVFRGLTVMAMIWVNDLARIRGIPAWLKHAPESADAMTFPDVVFPAFLFIVGMSIPMAVERRIAGGERAAALVGHVLARTLGLLAAGVLMVNIHDLDPQATGMRNATWAALMFLGVILAWNAGAGGPGRLRIGLRLVGVALLVWLAVVYRGAEGEQVTWLRTRWWGILGLIGWAYLVSAAVYLACRREPVWVAGAAALALALCIADRNGTLARCAPARAVNEYVSLGGHIGGHSFIVLTGVLAGMRLGSSVSGGRAGGIVAWCLIMAALLFCTGAVLRPGYGLSKIRVTPGWCLYCAAIGLALFALLYRVTDLRGHGRWSGPVRTVGGNALLAFLLPPLLDCLLRIGHVDFLDRCLGEGGIGITRSSLFTIVMVAAIAGLTRAGLRLRM